MISSSVRSPLRSSSALVATVVPIFTAPTWRTGIASPRLQAQQVADALHGGVGIGLGVLRQQLVRDQPAVRPAPHHVGEGAAAVDPEIPGLAVCHAAAVPVAHRLLQPPCFGAERKSAAQETGEGEFNYCVKNPQGYTFPTGLGERAMADNQPDGWAKRQFQRICRWCSSKTRRAEALQRNRQLLDHFIVLLRDEFLYAEHPTPPEKPVPNADIARRIQQLIDDHLGQNPEPRQARRPKAVGKGVRGRAPAGVYPPPQPAGGRGGSPRR